MLDDEWSVGCPVSQPRPGNWIKSMDWLRHPVGKVYKAGAETAERYVGRVEGSMRAGERAAWEVTEELDRERAFLQVVHDAFVKVSYTAAFVCGVDVIVLAIGVIKMLRAAYFDDHDNFNNSTFACLIPMRDDGDCLGRRLASLGY